jgi:hypothetical protein
MTTTQASLAQPVEIVDEYVRLGFESIFLRSISPYGFAVKRGMADRYHMGEWLEFYKRGLSHIIELNRRGIPLREEFAAIILQKICTPWPTGYVDLQSPAGIGIGGIVFNYDGDVYASDASRMLAEMRARVRPRRPDEGRSPEHAGGLAASCLRGRRDTTVPGGFGNGHTRQSTHDEEPSGCGGYRRRCVNCDSCAGADATAADALGVRSVPNDTPSHPSAL